MTRVTPVLEGGQTLRWETRTFLGTRICSPWGSCSKDKSHIHIIYYFHHISQKFYRKTINRTNICNTCIHKLSSILVVMFCFILVIDNNNLFSVYQLPTNIVFCLCKSH